MGDGGRRAVAWLACGVLVGGTAAAGAAGAAGAAAPAEAFPVPAAAGFTIVTNGADTRALAPQIAFDGSGDSIRVWTLDNDDMPGNSADIEAELADAPGQARGPAFQVNTESAGVQTSAVVAMNARGRSVVAWESFGQNGQEEGVYAQVYGPAGAAASGEIAVNATGAGHFALQPSVGIDALGNFAVAYQGDAGVYVRLFNPRGEPGGAPILLARGPDASSPSLAMHPNGSFAVIWNQTIIANGRASIYIVGQIMATSAAPLGRPFQINSSPVPDNGVPAVAALPDGGWLVAWDRCEFGHFDQGCAVRARRFNALGAPRGADFAVSPHDGRVHLLPLVAADVRGNMAVAWENCALSLSGPTDCAASVQFYDALGRPAPAPATLRDPQGDLGISSVAARPGGFAVVYSTGSGAYGWNFLFP